MESGGRLEKRVRGARFAETASNERELEPSPNERAAETAVLANATAVDRTAWKGATERWNDSCVDALGLGPSIENENLHSNETEKPDGGGGNWVGRASILSAAMSAEERKLRSLRTEKTSFPFSPQTELAKLEDALKVLKTDLEALTCGHDKSLRALLERGKLTDQDRADIADKQATDVTDLLKLDSLEMARELREAEALLEEIRGLPASKVKTWSDVANVEKGALLQRIRELAEPEQEPGIKVEAEEKQEKKPEISAPASAQPKRLNNELLSRLESRVSEMERLVGVSSMNRLSYAYSDLTTAVADLSTRLIFLDPKRLELLSKKSIEVASELNKACVIKGKLGGQGGYNIDPAKERKIEDLFALLERYNPLMNSLHKVMQKIRYLSLMSQQSGLVESRVTKAEEDVRVARTFIEKSEASIATLEDLSKQQIAQMTTILTALSANARDNTTLVKGR